MTQPIDPASLMPEVRSAERPCHECGELAYLTVSGEWRHMFSDPAHAARFDGRVVGEFAYEEWDFMRDFPIRLMRPWAEALATKLDHDLGGEDA